MDTIKRIRKHGREFVFFYPEALRLAGIFYWLAGKRNTAYRCWKEGLEITEKLGIRPEIDRISFLVARLLSSTDGRRRTLYDFLLIERAVLRIAASRYEYSVRTKDRPARMRG